MTMQYNVEYTDTFGGETNYSWVRRAVIPAPSQAATSRSWQRTLVRRAKAAVGLTGVRGALNNYGDGWEFRPYGSATVMFIWYKEPVD